MEGTLEDSGEMIHNNALKAGLIKYEGGATPQGSDTACLQGLGAKESPKLPHAAIFEGKASSKPGTGMVPMVPNGATNLISELCYLLGEAFPGTGWESREIGEPQFLLS